MKRVCVFCGSRMGTDDVYREAAESLGGLLAARGIDLVYGGGSIGLMGVVANAAIAAGGKVVGVIPNALAQKEVAHFDLADLRIVGSMHERKQVMADLSDAFVMLPGGVGTLEEFFEVVTWAQLGMHQKPCGLINVAGYYDRLLAFLDHSVEHGFLKPKHRDLILVAGDANGLLELLATYTPPPRTKKWIEPAST